jgi:hypothetical protein
MIASFVLGVFGALWDHKGLHLFCRVPALGGSVIANTTLRRLRKSARLEMQDAGLMAGFVPRKFRGALARAGIAEDPCLSWFSVAEALL